MTSGKIFAADINQVPVLKLVGDVRVLMSSTLEAYFSTLYENRNLEAVLVDLSETRGIDSTALGLLAKMSLQLKKRYGIKPTIVSTNANITNTLRSMNFTIISTIVSKPLEHSAQFGPVSEVQESEEKIRQRVIEAHQILMGLSDENRLQFQDLVHALKKEA